MKICTICQTRKENGKFYPSDKLRCKKCMCITAQGYYHAVGKFKRQAQRQTIAIDEQEEYKSKNAHRWVFLGTLHPEGEIL